MFSAHESIRKQRSWIHHMPKLVAVVHLQMNKNHHLKRTFRTIPNNEWTSTYLWPPSSRSSKLSQHTQDISRPTIQQDPHTSETVTSQACCVCHCCLACVRMKCLVMSVGDVKGNLGIENTKNHQTSRESADNMREQIYRDKSSRYNYISSWANFTGRSHTRRLKFDWTICKL